VGSEAVQHRSKVVHAGKGMRLNVQGILFTYKAVGEDTAGRYALTKGIVPPHQERHSTSTIVRMRRSTSSKASLKSNAAARSSKRVRGHSRCCRRGLPHRFLNLSDKTGQSSMVQSPRWNRGIL
jgi:hypothetical protein